MSEKRNRCGYSAKYPDFYNLYWGMRNRCENKNHASYERYGGRGISVCERWKGYEGFKNFVDDMYPKPSEDKYPSGKSIWSLDRIDTNKGYSPDNCKWSTSSEQIRNRRPKYKKVGVYKRKNCRKKWVAQYGENYKKISKNFYTEEEAVEQRIAWEKNNPFL